MFEKRDEIERFIKKFNSNDLAILENTETTRDIVKQLISAMLLMVDKNGQLKKITKRSLGIGFLRPRTNFGFVSTSEHEVFIHDTSDYIDSDLVLVAFEDKKEQKNREGEIVCLVERKINTLVGVVQLNHEVEILENKFFENYKIKLVDSSVENQLVNDYVKLQIIDVKGREIRCKVLTIIANKTDPDLQMKLVLSEFDIKTEFSEACLAEASIAAKTNVELTPGRVDLRDKPFITIDGKDAKDLDDAVLLVQENDFYRLYVSIADVSHYVKRGTKLDEEALERATSVYFIDRVVPMLPKEISNGICSLHPNVDRYTLTCEMKINMEGQVVESQLYESVINSKHRMTYEDVNKMLIENDPQLISKYADIYGILKEMNKLSKILNTKRLKRGAFNLEDKEPKFEIDENGKIIDIGIRVRYEAERLIEEFMIIANETVASTFTYAQLPFIYRVHAQPSLVKLQDLYKIFPKFGVVLKGDLANFHSQSFKTVLEEVDDPVAKRILSDLIVRSMQKAYYTSNNIGHFGLASKDYTHFTSPIRRYPDLIVHRKIREHIISNNYEVDQSEYGNLEYMAAHSSEKEVKAQKAENKIEDQKIAEYMQQFVNQEFIGKVSSITEFGFFVELENSARGLVRNKQLVDYIQTINLEIRLRNNKKISIADDIKVKLISVNLQLGLLDFEPVEFKTRKVGTFEGNSSKQKGKVRLRNSQNNRSGNSTKGKRNKVNKSWTRKPKRQLRKNQ